MAAGRRSMAYWAFSMGAAERSRLARLRLVPAKTTATVPSTISATVIAIISSTIVRPRWDARGARRSRTGGIGSGSQCCDLDHGRVHAPVLFLVERTGAAWAVGRRRGGHHLPSDRDHIDIRRRGDHTGAGGDRRAEPV